MSTYDQNIKWYKLHQVAEELGGTLYHVHTKDQSGECHDKIVIEYNHRKEPKL